MWQKLSTGGHCYCCLLVSFDSIRQGTCAVRCSTKRCIHISYKIIAINSLKTVVELCRVLSEKSIWILCAKVFIVFTLSPFETFRTIFDALMLIFSVKYVRFGFKLLHSVYPFRTNWLHTAYERCCYISTVSKFYSVFPLFLIFSISKR